MLAVHDENAQETFISIVSSNSTNVHHKNMILMLNGGRYNQAGDDRGGQNPV
jgi:hypothetical protein